MARVLLAAVLSAGLHAGMVVLALFGQRHPAAAELERPVSIAIFEGSPRAAAPKRTNPAAKSRPIRHARAQASLRRESPAGSGGAGADRASRGQESVARGAEVDAGAGQTESPGAAPFMALARLDRIREVPEPQAYLRMLDESLGFAAWRTCLRDSAGLELYADFDAILTTSGGRPEPGTSVIALRHHLAEARLQQVVEGLARWAGDGGSPACTGVRVIRPAPTVLVLVPAVHSGESTASPAEGPADGGTVEEARWNQLVARLDPEADPPTLLIAALAVNSAPGAPPPSTGPRLWPPPATLPRALSMAIRAEPEPTVELTAVCENGQQQGSLGAEWPLSRGNPFILLRSQATRVDAVAGQGPPQETALHATAAPGVVARALEMLVAFATAVGSP